MAKATSSGPQAVGNHLATCPDCENAYRVLTTEGRIAERFRWPHPGDTRDSQGLLRQEGVQFDVEGAADPGGRLSVTELRALALSRVGQDPPSNTSSDSKLSSLTEFYQRCANQASPRRADTVREIIGAWLQRPGSREDHNTRNTAQSSGRRP